MKPLCDLISNELWEQLENLSYDQDLILDELILCAEEQGFE